MVTTAISKKPYIKDDDDEPITLSSSSASLSSSSSSIATSSGSEASAASAASSSSSLSLSPSPSPSPPPSGYVRGSDIDVSGYEIGNVSATHMLAFNKFCMYRPHLLLLTRDGTRRQYEPLAADDLQSAWAALDALGWRRYFLFFNCGKDGGCSRLHKHLQLAPYLPDRMGPWPASAAASSGPGGGVGGVGPPAHVPYEYILRRFDAALGPKQVLAIYDQMLVEARRILGLAAPREEDGDEYGDQETEDERRRRRHVPHNLALGRNWILVIPRTKAGVDGAYGNTLGMLGMVSVASHDELDCWLRQGPHNVVAQLGVPARRDVS